MQLLNRFIGYHGQHAAPGQRTGTTAASWATSGVPLTEVFAVVPAGGCSTSHPGPIFFDFLRS